MKHLTIFSTKIFMLIRMSRSVYQVLQVFKMTTILSHSCAVQPIYVTSHIFESFQV